MEENLKVKSGTIVRTVILLLTFVNQLLSITGHKMIPISDDQINVLISTAITIGASVWAWWKNNSFTKTAIMSDAIAKKAKELGE